MSGDNKPLDKQRKRNYLIRNEKKDEQFHFEEENTKLIVVKDEQKDYYFSQFSFFFLYLFISAYVPCHLPFLSHQVFNSIMLV